MVDTSSSTRKKPHVRSYSAYGYAAVINEPVLLGYTGQLRDPISGCYLLGLGHRAYSPILMRFQSPDQLSPFDAGGINCYVYCLGDPLNHVDPSGRFGRRVQVPYRPLPMPRQQMSREVHGPDPLPSIQRVPNEQVRTYIAESSASMRRGLFMDATENALASIRPEGDASSPVGLLTADARFLEDTVHSYSRKIASDEQLGRAPDIAAVNSRRRGITLFQEIASGRRDYLMQGGRQHPGDPMYGQIERSVSFIRE
ncbi:RHS repeat-associated core domain-containing protein [Pseudomonas fakonensis]|uniref:RHS repeat-associated core domain-containing protein n=1 Tax=Pseudomonas fakonensis TaxID=2842355 RepID=UPI003F59836D